MLDRDGPKSFAGDYVGLEKTAGGVTNSSWRVRRPRFKSFTELWGSLTSVWASVFLYKMHPSNLILAISPVSPPIQF